MSGDLNTFTITIDKRKTKSKLGIDVDLSARDDLRVDAITGGLVMQWNRKNPQAQVKAGDCIVKVNEVTGDGQSIFAECRDALKLDITFRRGDPEGEAGVTHSNSDSAPTLSVTTWNVLSSAYASFKMYPHVDASVLRATRRRAQVSAALRHLAADVICLQEVDCPLEDLGLDPRKFDSCSAQRPGGRSDRCVIAWRRDRLEVGPAGHLVMNFDDHPPPRSFECDPTHYESGNVGLAIELRISNDPGRRCVTIATTHLNWEPQKMDVRAWQAHIFFDMAKNLSGSRVVLCGDFNCLPGTQPHMFLAQGCGLASVYSDVESTAVTNSNADAAPNGFAAMIDYIWYSPKWFSVQKRLALPSAEDLRSKEQAMGGSMSRRGSNASQDASMAPPAPTLLSESWPSDHLALSAVFELTIPTAEDVDVDFDFH